MRRITYAGETVVTSDDIGRVLVELTAELAKRGRAEAVTIPIALEDRSETASADLVIGLGNDVLSVPADWDGLQPEFDAQLAELQAHLDAFRPRDVAEPDADPDAAAPVYDGPDSLFSDLDLNTSDFRS